MARQSRQQPTGPCRRGEDYIFDRSPGTLGSRAGGDPAAIEASMATPVLWRMGHNTGLDRKRLHEARFAHGKLIGGF